MAEEIVYAAPYKFYARLIAGSGVFYACGVELRHYNDSRRHREQRGAAEQQIIQSAAFLVVAGAERDDVEDVLYPGVPRVVCAAQVGSQRVKRQFRVFFGAVRP